MIEVESAIIFAGGKSSRMGEDKSLLPFGGYSTLTEYQYKRLHAFFKHVYISSKEPKFTFSCKCIEDRFSIHSPLVALISVLENIEEEYIFILSVDSPFINKDIINSLKNGVSPKYNCVIAKTPQGVQPLCGIYSKSILPLAYKQLQNNNHKLHTLLQLATSNYITFNEDDPFTNINYPEEYKEALKLFEKD